MRQASSFRWLRRVSSRRFPALASLVYKLYQPYRDVALVWLNEGGVIQPWLGMVRKTPIDATASILGGGWRGPDRWHGRLSKTMPHVSAYSELG